MRRGWRMVRVGTEERWRMAGQCAWIVRVPKYEYPRSKGQRKHIRRMKAAAR